MKITFPEVSTKRTRYRKNPETGKSQRQVKKFWQTLSPYNQLPDGTVKTRDQIYAELEKEAEAWVKEWK